jgi:hypothetical protein
MNRTGKVLLVVGVAAWLFGCHQTLPEPGRPNWANEITRNRELWSKASLPNYRLLVTWGGPTVGTSSALVTVEAGKVVSVVDPTSGAPVNASAAQQLGVSVDKLFEILTEANSKPNATIAATFDAGLGYPKRFKINWNRDLTDAVEWAEIELQYAS